MDFPHLTPPRTSRFIRVVPSKFSEAMLYKLQTGCQMRYPSVKRFLAGAVLNWQGVYTRFNAWCKDGSWQTIWWNVFQSNKRWLHCFSVQLDGGLKPAKHRVAVVGYQRRKMARATTALFMADNHGQSLACATLRLSNHHNSFGLVALYKGPWYLSRIGMAWPGCF